MTQRTLMQHSSIEYAFVYEHFAHHDFCPRSVLNGVFALYALPTEHRQRYYCWS